MRFGLAMAPKGGRTAVVGLEVRERRGPQGRLEHEFLVGYVDRLTPGAVETARSRARELADDFADLRPCFMIDVGTPQGLALRQAMREDWPSAIHRPHAYQGTGDRRDLFAAFLGAYSTGRIKFLEGLEHRADLDKALVNYLGGGVKKDGVELSSEDEAMVIALGLALIWPRHGPKADGVEKQEAP